MAGAFEDYSMPQTASFGFGFNIKFNLQDNEKYKSIGKLLAVSFLTAAIASACTEDAMDKINENPNNPLDAPAKFLITDLGVSTAFSTVRGFLALFFCLH